MHLRYSRRIYWSGWSLILLLVSLSFVAAANCPDWAFQWGGPDLGQVWTVAVAGDHVFVRAEQYFLVFDASDRTHPVLLSRLPAYKAYENGEAATDGSWVYLAAGERGVQVIDVSDPVHPREVALTFAGGVALDVEIAGGYAYVANRRSGLQVLDVRDPVHPQLMGSVDTMECAYALAVADGYAYVADGPAGVRILDVSAPAEPREVALIDTPGTALEVVVSGRYAFVADDKDGGLRVIDVSVPERPFEVSSLALPGSAKDLTIAGDCLYVSLTDDWGSSLRLVDVSNPASPRELSAIGTQWVTHDVCVSGGFAFVANDWFGWQAIDVSDPADPHRAGAVAWPKDVRDMALSGGNAYLLDAAFGLRIFDLHKPVHPLEAGGRPDWRYASYVAEADGYVFLTDESANSLKIVDVSLPEKMMETGFLYYPSWGEAAGLAVSGGYAYIAFREDFGRSRLLVIDVGNPAKPKLAGSFYLPTYVGLNGLAVMGRYVYLFDNYFKLYVIDVSTPAIPVKIGDLTLPKVAWEMAVWRDLACVALGDGGLGLIDVRDPARPALVNRITSIGVISDVAVMGGIVYAVDFHSGLWAIDIDNPLQPVTLNYYAIAGDAQAVSVSPTAVLVDCGDAGVEILSPCATRVPAAPAGLRASGQGGGCVRLDWLDLADDESGYEVERSLDESGSWIPTAVLSPDTESWTDQGMIPGRRVSHRVRAFNVAGESAWSAPAMSIPPRYDAVIPAAAHTAGDDQANWRTRLDLLNLSGSDRTLELALLKANQANPDPETVMLTLPPGEPVCLEDVLGGVFQADNAALGLNFGGSGVLANSTFVRTSSACGGAPGAFIDAVPPGAALSGDGSSRACFHHLSYSPEDGEGFRTHLGLASGSPFEVEVQLRLYGDAGEELAFLNHLLQPFEHFQFSRVHELAGTPAVERGWATVEAMTPDGQVFSYAMVIDNVSGDPVYLAPDIIQRPNSPRSSMANRNIPANMGSSSPVGRQGRYDVVIPAAAHTNGFHQAVWRTDLDLLNLGTAEQVVEVAMLAADQANPAPVIEEVILPPGQAVRLEDVLGEVFDHPNASLGVVTPAEIVLANARFYNIASVCGGAQATAIAGMGQDAALMGDGGSLGILFPLSYKLDEADGARTNIGFLNGTEKPAAVEILLHGDAGERIGALGLTLEPFEHVQISKIHEFLETPEISHGFALVGVLTPGGRVYAYAMVVDNISGDPGFLPAKVLPREATRPSPPSWVRAEQAGAGEIQLTWPDSADNELGYWVHRQADGVWAESTFLADLGPNATGFRDSGLTDGSGYSYWVTAYNLRGQASGIVARAVAAGFPPGPPLHLTARLIDGPLVDLNWTDGSTTELGFEVERARRGGGEWTLLARVAADAVRWTDGGVEPGSAYCYRVRAFNSVGMSAECEEVCLAAGPPAAPTDLTALGLGHEVGLQWRDNSNSESGFRLERQPSRDASWEILADLPADSAGYYDRTVELGRTCRYRVKALGGAGDSAYSDEAAAAPVACPDESSRFRVGALPFDLVAEAGYLYLVYSSVFKVIDVSNPVQLQEVGQLTSQARIYDLAVQDSFAYLACSSCGLQIVDAREPSRPVEVGHASIPSYTYRVAVSGDYAYVSCYDPGLRIFDISDPAQPIEVGALELRYGSEICASESGKVIYVAQTDGISTYTVLAIDVADPARPSQLGVLGPFNRINAMVESNGCLVLAEHGVGLRILDVRIPTQLQEASTFELPGGAEGVAIAGGYAYVTLHGQPPYEGELGPGLRVIDVSDPLAPWEIGFLETPDLAFSLAAADGSAFVAMNSYHLVVYDLAACDFE